MFREIRSFKYPNSWNIFRKNIFPKCTLKFESIICGRVKVLGRVLKNFGKVLRRVLKKVGKVRIGLNKIGLIFSRGKMLVTYEKRSHFSLTFFLR